MRSANPLARAVEFEPQGKVVLHFSTRQPIESKLRTLPVDLQILVNGPNRMPFGCNIHRPIGRKNKDRRFTIPPRNAR